MAHNPPGQYPTDDCPEALFGAFPDAVPRVRRVFDEASEVFCGTCGSWSAVCGVTFCGRSS